MALDGQTIDVQLLPVNQQRPDTSSIPGQLLRAVNAVVEQYTKDDTARLRLSKRNGFSQQPIENRSVTSGAIIVGNESKFAGTPALYSSLLRQQVVISNSLAYVLAEEHQSWSRFDYIAPTANLRKANVYTPNKQIGANDAASVVGATCHIWADLLNDDQYFYVVDRNGTPIRSPVKSDGTGNTIPNGAVAKVAADPFHFWIIYTASSELHALLLDVNGNVMANSHFGDFNEGDPNVFDVTYQNGSIWVAQVFSFHTKLHKLAWSGSAITDTATELFPALAEVAVAWAENVTSDGFLYLLTATFDPDATSVEWAYRIETVGTPSVDFTWQLFDEDGNGGHAGAIYEMAGCQCSDGLLHTMLSFWFTTGQARCVTVSVLADPGGPVSEGLEVRQSICASRTFTMNSRQHVAMFYPSSAPISSVDPVTHAVLPGFSQPTYFFVDLITQQITGRFEYANASGLWAFNDATFPTVSPYAFKLPSPHFGAQSSTDVFETKIPLCYYASTVETSTNARLSAINAAATQDIITPITVPEAFLALSQFETAGTSGIADYILYENGRAVEFNGELFIPGPMAIHFEGPSFSEHGLNLAVEKPLSVTQMTTVGALMTLLGTYSYVLLWEWTDQKGNRHRSPASPAFTVTLTGTQNSVQLQGQPLSFTNHADVSLGVYRTAMDGLTPTTIFKKVSNDLNPTFNHPQDQTWTFLDTASDVQQGTGETYIYGDGGQGFINREPCPAFRAGCVFQDRLFMVAWDNRIWYSSSMDDADGNPLWFNSSLQSISLPGDDIPVGINAMDGRLIIRGQTGFWEVPGTGFTNPNGTGSDIQPPQRLPFNCGSKDLAVLSNKGLVFVSNRTGLTGGLMLLTRGLNLEQFSNEVQDQVDGRTIIGLDVDKGQRLLCTVLTNDDVDPVLPAETFAYDQLAQVWTSWTLPSNALLTHSMLGNMSYVDSDQLMLMTDGTFIDRFSHDSPATSDAVLADWETAFIPIGGIKNFKRCWQYLFNGSYKGQHELTVTVTADSNGDELQTVFSPEIEADETYQFILMPTVEEASRVKFRFQDSFFDVESPGDSFTLDLISFYVALEKGLTRLEIEKQVAWQVPNTMERALQRARLVAGISSPATQFEDSFDILPGDPGSPWSIATSTGTTTGISRASNGWLQLRADGDPGPSGDLIINCDGAGHPVLPNLATGRWYVAFSVRFMSDFNGLVSFGEGINRVLSTTAFFNGYDDDYSATHFNFHLNGSATGQVFTTKELDHDRYVIEMWAKADGHIYASFDASVPVRSSFVNPSATFQLTTRADALPGGISIVQVESVIAIIQ